MPETYQRIPVEAITPSPYQQRTMFGGQEDDELAESVGKHGVLQPIRVRQNGSPETFELVFGERRWRAAKAAGLVDVPAIVVSITDDQAIDEILIENLRRKDLHPLEEALGYQQLLEKRGYTMEQLVAKTGKSKAHLYGRLKLTEMAPGPRKAFLDGKLSASIAELIARIPVAKLQEAATKEVLGLGEWKDYEASNVQPESIGGEGKRDSDATTQPLSFRAAAAHIRKRYSLKLALASFSPTDADLVPSAGACATCEHRSGNQPELGLPGLEKTPDDLCTNPPCFEAKTSAAWKAAAADAKSRGLEVVEGKKAEAIFVWNGDVQPGSPYVDLTTRIPYDIDPTGDSSKTFGKMLGKKAAEVPRALVQGPNGEPREMLVKAKAVELLRAEGKLDKPTKPGPKASTKEEKEAEAKRRAKEQEKELHNEQALRQVLAKAADHGAAMPEKKELATWKWMARVIITGQGFSSEDEGTMLHRRSLDKTDDLLDVIEKARTVADVRSIVMEYLLTCVSSAKTGGFASKETKDLFDDAMRLFSVDWHEQLDLAKEAAKEAKRKAASEEDDGKAKAKKGARK